MRSHTPFSTYSDKRPLLRLLLMLGAFPILIVLAFVAFFYIGTKKAVFPPLWVVLGLLFMMFCFAFVYFFLYRVFVHRFFSSLGRSGIVGANKKRKPEVDLEKIFDFKLFDIAHEALIVQELKKRHEQGLDAAAKKFDRQSGHWKLGLESHFSFPVSDHFYESRLKMLKKNKSLMNDLNCGVVAVVLDAQTIEQESDKALFDFYSVFIAAVGEVVSQYGGHVYFSNGAVVAAIFAGEWSLSQGAIRTIKAARELNLLLEDRYSSIDCGVVADILPAREGFVPSAMGMRYFCENSLLRTLRFSTGTRVRTGLHISSRVVSAVKSGRVDNV